VLQQVQSAARLDQPDKNAVLLIGSSVLSCSTAGASIWWDGVETVQLPGNPCKTFFAYDLYTAKLYRLTIVFVGLVSSIIALVDRYLVDGLLTLSAWPRFQWRA